MITRSTRTRQIAGASAIALLLGALPAIGSHPTITDAASGLQLLTQAERNTNAVTSLSHHGTQNVVGPTATISLTLHGTEDEIHNRETDSESVQLVSKTSTGKLKKSHYNLDIVFLNGKTYFRTSFSGSKWQTVAGMSLRDPYTGVGWRRARTTVPTIASLVKHLSYRVVGASGGLTHFHATFKQAPIAGTDDIWVSGGAHPFVVREQQRYHSITKLHQTVVATDNFGSFNTPMLISAPTKQAGA